MSSFDLFREKMRNDRNCRVKYESRFIVEGSAATTIKVLRLDQTKPAALTLTDREGPDIALVYTYKEDFDQNQELLKGDYFTWKDSRTYFVYEDIDVVRDVGYKKQKAYQCNVSANFREVDRSIPAYFLSSLAKYVDDTLQQSLVIGNNEKPILIMPYQDFLKVGSKLSINKKPWKVVEFDFITNDGIAYLSLELDFVDKNTGEPLVAVEDDQRPTIVAGAETEMDIKFGYFKASPSVEIVFKTKDKVVFKAPYGVEEIVITTKDENKIDVSENYKVVMVQC